MGSTINKLLKREQEAVTMPRYEEIVIQNIDEKHFKFKLEMLGKLEFIQSDVGNGANDERQFNLDVRKSMQTTVKMQKLPPELRLNYFQDQPWRVMKYDNGYFRRHVDRERHTHQAGTQILLPPAKYCNYEGGELILYEYMGKQQEQKVIRVTPNQKLWTYIYFPLGIEHQVTQVQGTRISFVRHVIHRIYKRFQELNM